MSRWRVCDCIAVAKALSRSGFLNLPDSVELRKSFARIRRSINDPANGEERGRVSPSAAPDDLEGEELPLQRPVATLRSLTLVVSPVTIFTAGSFCPEGCVVARRMEHFLNPSDSGHRLAGKCQQ